MAKEAVTNNGLRCTLPRSKMWSLQSLEGPNDGPRRSALRWFDLGNQVCREDSHQERSSFFGCSYQRNHNADSLPFVEMSDNSLRVTDM